MTMTADNLEAWKAMVANGMKQEVLIERLADWAEMLEARVAQFDPEYRGYYWGQNKEDA